MPRSDASDSNIDLPASVFTVISIDRVRSIVRVVRGTLSFDEVVELLTDEIRTFDWETWTAQVTINKQALSASFETMIDVLSLLSEIDLNRSREVWTQHAPAHAGMPRMLTRTGEAHELRYLHNLATQRGLDDDELALHLLNEGSFMSDWAEARREFVLVAE